MDLSERIARARIEGAIDGLALALIKDGEIIQGFSGHSDQKKQLLVTAQTVFPAASLSKPVFAYAVLELVEQGVLSLDTRLAGFVDYAPGDEFAAEITAAHVLSHTTGFPNWRSSEQPLKHISVPASVSVIPVKDSSFYSELLSVLPENRSRLRRSVWYSSR